MVKKPPANAGDLDSISGSGRSLEKGMVTHSSMKFFVLVEAVSQHSAWHSRNSTGGRFLPHQVAFSSHLYLFIWLCQVFIAACGI